VITPNESVTWVPRHKTKDGPSHVPVLAIAGDSRGRAPPPRQRVTTFSGTLVVGRREASQTEPRQASLVLLDKMVSGQHLAISPAPDEGAFEITDLSSTNGTIVDGEAIDSTMKLRDGAVIFVGSHVLVVRVATAGQLAAIQEEIAQPLGPVPTVNPSFAMVCKKIRKLAEAGQELLLTGETGAGKEIYANAIHRVSGRAGPFVAVNCAALPRELVESELFGYARGAHSQAAMAKPGIIEQAEGGTLFLDEVGEMTPALQAKLLHVLESGNIRAVGAVREREVDVRIIAATHQNLPQAVREGRFREDLLYRLDVVSIVIPALRDSRDDIRELLDHFFASVREKYPQSPVQRFGAEALRVLERYRWPGNVRELAHTVEKLVLLGADAEVAVGDLPETITGAARPDPLAFGGDILPLRELERRYAAWALAQTGGHRGKTAEKLGVDPKTLRKYLGDVEEE